MTPVRSNTDEQAQLAMNDVHTSVDAFVQRYAIIEVATVNEMAADAARRLTPEAIALQEYMDVNDVILDDQEVQDFNDSLQAVEVAAQTAGAYMAVANDAQMIQTANDSAAQFQATYEQQGHISMQVQERLRWTSQAMLCLLFWMLIVTSSLTWTLLLRVLRPCFTAVLPKGRAGSFKTLLNRNHVIRV